MLQEVFGGKLLGLDVHAALSDRTKKAIVAAAAGLVGLISLFNSLGRIFWASMSDYLGRKNTYFVFFILGIVLYAPLPTLGHMGLALAFVASVCVILTMYGGGFATIPAYLADIFGTQMVGAIHGRLITAWSVAGVAGPDDHRGHAPDPARQRRAEKPRLRRHALHHGGAPVRRPDLQPAGAAGEREELHDRRRAGARAGAAARSGIGGTVANAARGSAGAVFVGIIAWLAVGIPFAIGLYIALQKAAALF